MALANQIKEVRKLLGVSQSQAAKRWRVSVRTLQGWESGRSPSGFALVHLRAILEQEIRSAKKNR